MPARLVRSEAFELDVRSQADWLERHGDLVRLLRLAEELRQLESLLAKFPQSGVRVEISRVELRKALLSKLPFVVWYAYDATTNEVQVLRLFHAHQHRRRGKLRRGKR